MPSPSAGFGGLAQLLRSQGWMNGGLASARQRKLEPGGEETQSRSSGRDGRLLRVR